VGDRCAGRLAGAGARPFSTQQIVDSDGAIGVIALMRPCYCRHCAAGALAFAIAFETHPHAHQEYDRAPAYEQVTSIRTTQGVPTLGAGLLRLGLRTHQSSSASGSSYA